MKEMESTHYSLTAAHDVGGNIYELKICQLRCITT